MTDAVATPQTTKWVTAVFSSLLGVAGLIIYGIGGTTLGLSLVFVAVLAPLVVAYLKRQQVELYLRHRLHLEVVATVSTNRIPEKARAYQSRKDDIEAVLVLGPMIAWFIWFFVTGEVWLPVIVGVLVGFGAGIGWLFLRDMYRERSRAREAWEATLHTAYKDPDGVLRKMSVTDHWSVQWEPLNPDDPKVVEARRIIQTSQQKWRREMWAKNVRAPDAQAPPAPQPPPPPPEPGFHCTGCGHVVEPNGADTPTTAIPEYCAACGAKLLPDEYFYLINRVDADEQYLLYTDCVINRHLNPIPNTLVYLGIMPTRMPCSKVSLVETGTSIKDATGNLTTGIPIVMFVDSAENIDRVLGLQQAAVASPERMDGVERVMDGYLCVAGAQLIRMHENKEQSLEDTLNRVQAEQGKSTMRALDITRKQGPPPPPPKPPRIGPRLRRILKFVVLPLAIAGTAITLWWLFGPSVLLWLGRR